MKGERKFSVSVKPILLIGFIQCWQLKPKAINYYDQWRFRFFGTWFLFLSRLNCLHYLYKHAGWKEYGQFIKRGKPGVVSQEDFGPAKNCSTCTKFITKSVIWKILKAKTFQFSEINKNTLSKFVRKITGNQCRKGIKKKFRTQILFGSFEKRTPDF